MAAAEKEDGCEWYFGIPFKSKRAAVTAAPSAQEPKYKEGDVVRVVDDRGGGKVGDVATVTGVDATDLESDGYYYKLTGLSNDGMGLYEKRLEAHVARKLKVGDRVRLREDNRGYGNVGDTGSIISVSGNTARIKFDTFSVLGDSKWCAPFDRIQILPTFTPGTRVRLTRNTHRYAVGDTGTVTVQSEDSVGVRMDEGRYWSFAPEVLEVVAGGDAPDCSASNGEQEDKPKFKAGDRVTTEGADGEAGVGVVLSYDGDGNYKVKFDTWYGTCTEPEHWLTLVTSAPANDPATPCIVMRLDDGKPAPSYCPHVHDTAASATKEAERLASINPGKQFDVYQRVTGRVAEVNVIMREVA